MNKFLTIIFLLLASLTISAQSNTSVVERTQHYEFRINYWFNMHHMLWTEAFMRTELDSSIVELELPAEEMEPLNNALQYYRENLVEQDLRTSKYMQTFREWITKQGPNTPSTPDQFAVHMKVLFSFDAFYREHFWGRHKNACEMVLAENLDWIKATEETYVENISKLTRQAWQSDPIWVDITYYGKISKRNLRNRPYTSIYPTHVVINVMGDITIPGNWLELLYHESAHHLILSSSFFVNGTINDVAEINELQVPRQLWHAYLFYFTGVLTQQLLTAQGVDYPDTYMQRVGVFSRYHEQLELHLPAYMNREITLAEASLRILRGLAERD